MISWHKHFSSPRNPKPKDSPLHFFREAPFSPSPKGIAEQKTLVTSYPGAVNPATRGFLPATTSTRRLTLLWTRIYFCS
ncbi:MAG: hypothetical protein CMN03_09155 [Roseibacillus sp.]|nr:hypothetical protein [Roseibacillus sp.]